MEVKYKTCNGCGFSYINQIGSYTIDNDNFCSSTCITKCGGCNKRISTIYCKTNHQYFCTSCEQERCRYCNLFKKGYKCPNKCE